MAWWLFRGVVSTTDKEGIDVRHDGRGVSGVVATKKDRGTCNVTWW